MSDFFSKLKTHQIIYELELDPKKRSPTPPDLEKGSEIWFREILRLRPLAYSLRWTRLNIEDIYGCFQQ